MIDEFNSDFVIMAGDFNLVMNPELDYYNYRRTNNPNARKQVLKLMEEHNLSDVWRVQHDNIKRYTWSTRNPTKRARLDFFLLSDELLTVLDASNISHGYRSDHSMIDMTIKFGKQVKGKGFWRFNNSLLKERDFSNLIKNEIKRTKQQYCVLSENESIESVEDKDVKFSISDDLFFDTLLMNLRGVTISYASYRKKSRENREVKLESDINALQNSEDLSNESQSLLNSLIAELEELRKEKIKGVMLRCNARWIEDGEKPSKYFCSLEKRNFINKTVSKLVDENNEIISEHKEILLNIKNFYESLYTSRDDELSEVEISSLISSNDIPKLSEEEAIKLEDDITLAEAGKVLKKMKNNKSPGPDGFTTEFFKFFWTDLRVFLLRSWKFAFIKKELSITQRQGIISILPKVTYGNQREIKLVENK
ncbi:hypothetical protein FSP39_001875 [Pinctada imbricata]|uniref:Endonuclease/exonuclease/phosphatase domain-containing protein n=1 Tax=Pinctada imbricata TaxID=66713 RepID=A0AA88YU63_PINIB|nr:hypothetical protein FSP39_001875 [Pinctada imbricata]